MSDAMTIERDPAYPTWEAERTALVLRQTELASLIAKAGSADDESEAAYQKLLAEGYSDDYCHDAADTILTDHAAKVESMRDEHRRINARLSIIKPYVTRERLEAHREVDRNGNDYHDRLFGYLGRIATALEAMAERMGCESPDRHKKNGQRKARTA